jgi:hypothetical protein
MDDVRGCLVLSRDGLVLGAFPEDEEASVKPSWLKFVHVGDARRSFVEFGDQIWAFVHRGPYSAFVVAGTAVRPGVLLDQLEQALLLAEETRAKRDTLKVPDAAAAPSGKPRTSLHPAAEKQQTADVASAPDQRPWSRGIVRSGGSQPPAASAGGGQEPIQPPDVAAAAPKPAEAAAAPPVAAATPAPVEAAETVHAEAGTAAPPVEAPSAAPPEAPPPAPAGEDAASDQPVTGLRREPQKLVGSGWATGEDQGEGDTAQAEMEEVGEIDRVMLAKEFSGLLQLDTDGDEGE